MIIFPMRQREDLSRSLSFQVNNHKKRFKKRKDKKRRVKGEVYLVIGFNSFLVH